MPSSYATSTRSWFILIFRPWLGRGVGYKVVNFVVEALFPGMIKSDLALTAAVTAIEEILVRCASSSDDRIAADSINFFPNQISGLTDDKI
jgi:hypothetical protein